MTYTPTPISLDDETLDLLNSLALAEDRNRSSMVRVLIREGAEKRGIVKIEQLPGPADAERPLVVYVESETA